MLGKFLANNEILKSFHDGVEDKISSPVYGIFIISWAIFHWELLYATFFVDEQKIWDATGGMLKNDYLSETYFNFSDPAFYILWILPFALTWLFIWKFPKWIAIPAFEKNQEYSVEKSQIKINSQKRIIEMELDAVKLMGKKNEEEKKVRTQKKEIENIDPASTWVNELEKITSNDKNLQSLREGKRAVYETNGRFSSNVERLSTGYNSYISGDSLSRLDTLGLIKIVSDKRDVIDFTDKGKFIVGKLQESNVL